jgi:hypothetical protein
MQVINLIIVIIRIKNKILESLTLNYNLKDIHNILSKIWDWIIKMMGKV